MTRRPRLPALLSGPLTALVLLVGVAAPPARAADGTGQVPARQVPARQVPAWQLQALLDSLVAKGAPGALAVVDDGRTRIRRASGAARLRPREPLRPNARFRVGSVTKTFVATVALQLVHERRLRLDDTVERWLPGLVPNGRAITVRMLLNHTSGLYNYTDDRAFLSRAMQNPLRPVTPRHLVAVATAHRPLFPPGTRWSYSNTGYVVAGLVIEKAGGQRLERLIRTRILQPLALRDTTFPTRPGIAGYHAHGYLATARNGGRLVDITQWSPSLAWAAGAMVSTADDLSRFYAALLGGRLLPARLLAEMTTTVPAGERAGYGLGLIRQGGRCGTRWGHNGSVPGYVTVASADRAGRRTAVVMMSVQPNPVLAPVLRRTIDVATCGGSSPARAAAA